MKKIWTGQFAGLGALLTLIGLIVYADNSVAYTDGQMTGSAKFGLVIAAVGYVLWFLPLCRLVMGSVETVLRPIPNPMQIEQALWQEWGRRPTLEEVGSVHQMLMAKKNHDLLVAGMTLGAIYYLGHHDHV